MPEPFRVIGHPVVLAITPFIFRALPNFVSSEQQESPPFDRVSKTDPPQQVHLSPSPLQKTTRASRIVQLPLPIVQQPTKVSASKAGPYAGRDQPDQGDLIAVCERQCDDILREFRFELALLRC